MKKVISILFASVLIIACNSPKESKKEPFEEFTNLVDQYAKNTLDRDHINTLALAIYKDGKVYNNYYGEIDKGQANKPNDSTLFEIASISKVFLGSLTAKAVLDGKLSLNDSIQNYLGNGYSNLNYNGDHITIKDLLTHTLGLKNKTPDKLAQVLKNISAGNHQNKPIPYGMEDLLEELKTVTLDKKPGTYYEYSFVGPELLAYTLQQVYNKPYHQLLREFLDELEMNDSYLLGQKKSKKQIANGYNDKKDIAPIDKNPLLGGAGGVVATMPDLIKFMTFQLESDNPLIKEANRELFKGEDDNVGYLWEGLGVGEEEGFYYSKTGTSSGTQSGLLICPDSSYGIIVIANSTSDAAFKDWANLFFTKIENDLIKYPKINLRSLVKPAILKDIESGKKEFNKLKDDKKYFNTSFTGALNGIGYDMMASKKTRHKAIELIEYATKEEPENANLYDSLGEAYFTVKDYKNALLNYKKAFKMNPDNTNAEFYIKEIESLIKN